MYIHCSFFTYSAQQKATGCFYSWCDWSLLVTSNFKNSFLVTLDLFLSIKKKIFLKKQLLVSLIFYIVFLFPILSVFYFDSELYYFLSAHFVFFFFNYSVYLFLAALGLRCCARAFSSFGKQGLQFVVVPAGFSLRWLLLLQSTGSRRVGLSSCGTWA